MNGIINIGIKKTYLIATVYIYQYVFIKIKHYAEGTEVLNNKFTVTSNT